MWYEPKNMSNETNKLFWLLANQEIVQSSLQKHALIATFYFISIRHPYQKFIAKPLRICHSIFHRNDKWQIRWVNGDPLSSDNYARFWVPHFTSISNWILFKKKGSPTFRCGRSESVKYSTGTIFLWGTFVAILLQLKWTEFVYFRRTFVESKISIICPSFCIQDRFRHMSLPRMTDTHMEETHQFHLVD